MMVEIIKEFKHNRSSYVVGERIASNDELPEDVLTFWCKAGWAKDLAGIVPIGNPGTQDVVLLVDNISQSNSVGNV